MRTDRLRARPGIEKRPPSQLMVLFRRMRLDKMELAQIVARGRGEGEH